MFLNYMNNFRGVAILFIVAVHVLHKLRTVFGWDNSDASYAIVSAVVSNGTVLFVFISGFLFQHLSARFRYGAYLNTKWRNIILPYLIVSIPAIAVHLSGTSSLPNPYAGYAPVAQVLLFYATGLHLLPLWFIPMLVLFYLLSPVLVRFDRARWPYWLLLPLLAIATVTPRPFDNIPVAFVHYFPVYVFGMFCSRYRQEVLTVAARYLPALIALFVGLVALDAWISFGAERVIATNSLTLWDKLILAVVLMYLLYRYDGMVKQRFGVLAATSFGIYFVHQYLIEIASRFLPTEVAGHASRIAAFILLTAAVTAISVLLLQSAKRIVGVRSRMLVGY